MITKTNQTHADAVRKAQGLAYGTAWIFTVYQNGIGAQLHKQGKTVGYSLFYATWAEALAEIQPVSWVDVFVTVSDAVFLPR